MLHSRLPQAPVKVYQEKVSKNVFIYPFFRLRFLWVGWGGVGGHGYNLYLTWRPIWDQATGNNATAVANGIHTEEHGRN